jgi:hypothetical protein
MKPNKERHNPDKIQNNYGGDYECVNYDKINNKEFCHDEGQSGWNQFIKWGQTDDIGNLKCKGNRHNCNKLYFKWLASLSEKQKEKYNNE